MFVMQIAYVFKDRGLSQYPQRLVRMDFVSWTLTMATIQPAQVSLIILGRHWLKALQVAGLEVLCIYATRHLERVSTTSQQVLPRSLLLVLRVGSMLWISMKHRIQLFGLVILKQTVRCRRLMNRPLGQMRSNSFVRSALTSGRRVTLPETSKHMYIVS